MKETIQLSRAAARTPPITLPLATMTVNDKIQVMESIWLSISQEPSGMDSPAWHHDVLAARKARIAAGTARYDDWDKAKRRIRAAVQP